MERCQDNYTQTFGSLALMVDYHERQSSESTWQRMPVSELRVLPLEDGSKGRLLQFAPPVSQTAIEDTVSNAGLAAETDAGLFPLRKTAIPSLLDRAKISGTVLQKLPRRDLASILNTCLKEHKSDALLLIRDEKISAVLSGDDKDYSILPIDQLMKCLQSYLDDAFPGYEFEGGYSDHSVTMASWKLSGQCGVLLDTYKQALAAHGQSGTAGRFYPGIKFITSDVGGSCASVLALLYGFDRPIRIGSVVQTEHRRQSTVTEFEASLQMLYAKYTATVEKFTALLDIELEYPVNAMIGVCKSLKLPKKFSAAAIESFAAAYGSEPATAHDVYMGLQEILFLMKSEGATEAQLLAREETLSRALHINWQSYDIAMGVSL